MEEYVRRKDVAAMLENAAIISDGEYSGYCTEDVSLGSIPAADVAPVRRGEWEANTSAYISGFYICSACRFPVETMAAPRRYRYCPGCGAKMDGGEQK